MFSECFFFSATRCFLTKNILDKPLKVSAILIVCSDVFGKPKIAYRVILKTYAKKSKVTEVTHFIPSLWPLHFTKNSIIHVACIRHLQIVSEFLCLYTSSK